MLSGPVRASRLPGGDGTIDWPQPWCLAAKSGPAGRGVEPSERDEGRMKVLPKKSSFSEDTASALLRLVRKHTLRGLAPWAIPTVLPGCCGRGSGPTSDTSSVPTYCADVGGCPRRPEAPPSTEGRGEGEFLLGRSQYSGCQVELSKVWGVWMCFRPVPPRVRQAGRVAVAVEGASAMRIVHGGPL